MSDDNCTPLGPDSVKTFEDLAKMATKTANPGHFRGQNRIGKSPDILERAAQTFRERNEVYGNNSELAARLLHEMFSEGLPPMDARQWEVFHLLLIKVVKIARFVQSDMTHIDSIHDDAVYSAMIESILRYKTDDE